MGEGSLDQVTKEGPSSTRKIRTSGSAVTKGNSASAYTGVKTGFFPKPGVSTKAVQVHTQAKFATQATFPANVHHLGLLKVTATFAPSLLMRGGGGE